MQDKQKIVDLIKKSNDALKGILEVYAENFEDGPRGGKRRKSKSGKSWIYKKSDGSSSHKPPPPGEDITQDEVDKLFENIGTPPEKYTPKHFDDVADDFSKKKSKIVKKVKVKSNPKVIDESLKVADKLEKNLKANKGFIENLDTASEIFSHGAHELTEQYGEVGGAMIAGAALTGGCIGGLGGFVAGLATHMSMGPLSFIIDPDVKIGRGLTKFGAESGAALAALPVLALAHAVRELKKKIASMFSEKSIDGMSDEEIANIGMDWFIKMIGKLKLSMA